MDDDCPTSYIGPPVGPPPRPTPMPRPRPADPTERLPVVPRSGPPPAAAGTVPPPRRPFSEPVSRGAPPVPAPVPPWLPETAPTGGPPWPGRPERPRLAPRAQSASTPEVPAPGSPTPDAPPAARPTPSPRPHPQPAPAEPPSGGRRDEPVPPGPHTSGPHPPDPDPDRSGSGRPAGGGPDGGSGADRPLGDPSPGDPLPRDRRLGPEPGPDDPRPDDPPDLDGQAPGDTGPASGDAGRDGPPADPDASRRGSGTRGWEPWDDEPDEDPRSLRRALGAAALSTFAPGTGHLLLGRRGTGAAILTGFLAVLGALLVALTLVPRTSLVLSVLSSRALIIGALVCLIAAAAWIGVIIRSYLIGRPRGLGTGRRAVAAATVGALCLVVAAPLGYGASLANSQRNLLETLFRGGDGGTPAAEAIAKPRLNVLLVGSDAGPDRTGARTDTMMVASIDTRTGRTTLFGLPRNIGYAQFPAGSPMYREFPEGFHNRADPTSGDYLLNAVFAYGHQHPQLAPARPTADPGLNLLHQTISQMLGLQLDYYVEVNMAGFASIIDALGGVVVDVGPQRIPIGGITPSGRLVRPDGYIEPGTQRLDGRTALAFARSRTGSTDYARMGRQRCLLQSILAQKSPADVLTNFRAVAAATTNSVSTNIPQEVLPALATLAGVDTLTLESVSFDPDLPDPNSPDGRFNTGRPDFPYMREVVRNAVDRGTAPAGSPVLAPNTSTASSPAPPRSDALPSSPPSSTRGAAPSTDDAASGDLDGEPASVLPPATAVPTSVAASCG